MENFNMFGVMIDCSRNAVMKVSEVKKYAHILSKMGYNTLMLYTEDTFEVDNEPLFGYLRGRYSKAELKEIDDYCHSIGIELIPCIQTLAHLNAIFKWEKEYGDIRDLDDVLFIGEDRTYQLIENMFSTISQCFRSKRIHIGMDEAYNVGLGKFLRKNGYKDRFTTLVAHLNKVCEIGNKYGFNPMIWSDMFCKLGLGFDYTINATGLKASDVGLPDNVDLVYWDYYSKDLENYNKKIILNQRFGNNVVFAGGAWTWKGFAPDNQFSIEATKIALTACKEQGVKDVFLTSWGDDGNECSKYSVLPALMFSIEYAKGNEDLDSIKSKFKEIVGVDFDSFMLLDKLNTPGGEHIQNPNKYLIFNDVFLGTKDTRCTEDDCYYYADLLKQFNKLENLGEYEYLFETAKRICEVIYIKGDLGVRTRQAYKRDDKVMLEDLAENDYSSALAFITDLHKTFQSQWFKENKPHGFDVQDIRFGGLIQRLKSCRERLVAYSKGEIESIPELEEELINTYCGPAWTQFVSPNVI